MNSHDPERLPSIHKHMSSVREIVYLTTGEQLSVCARRTTTHNYYHMISSLRHDVLLQYFICLAVSQL